MDDIATTDRQRAIERLKAKRGFSAALVSYVIVNAALWIIWALGDDHAGVPWPLWVTVFWGVGMAFSAWNVYGAKPISEDDIQREMQRGA